MNSASNKIFNFTKLFALPAIALLVFFCFEQKITGWLKEFCDSWFENCDESFGGAVIIALVVLATLFVWLKGNKKRLSLSHFLWSSAFVIVYVYYRCSDDFSFWEFSLLGHQWVFVDLFAIPFLSMTIIQVVLLLEKATSYENYSLLDQDEPINDVKKDLLGYGTIIKDLLSDLKLLDLSKRSFSVGVVGEWGIGKSSFFNLFEKILEDEEKDSIIVKFNPRSSAKLEDIQKDFFDAFAQALTPYHSGIARDMGRYQEALQLPENNFVIRLLRVLPSLATSNSKAVINNVIKVIKKRIYVFVDDFDRLTAKEILEVMKVIDRNGDFCQTVFVAAYDKEYVNNVLKNYLKHRKKDTFTDKYFNHEIQLPVQSWNVLYDYVRHVLSEKLKIYPNDSVKKEQILTAWDMMGQRVAPQLHTLRHTKRFMNIFLTRYDKVKNDVDFGDFISVTLLRYYDINVYHALVEGKLTKGGGLLSGPHDKVLYQADDMESQLKNYSHWDVTIQILTRLFDKQNDGSYELTPKYRRLCWKDSFPCYFYDYQPNGIYHKDLMQLYDAQSEDGAIETLYSLLDYDQEKNIYSQRRYVVVENFLRVRPVSELRNANDVKRLFMLLSYINQFLGRSINIEVTIAYLMGKIAEQELNNICNGKYKSVIDEAIRHNIERHPLGLAFVLIEFNNDILSQKHLESDYLFSQNDIQNYAEWCQKYYFKKIESITPQNMEAVVNLSRIKCIENDKTVTSKAANAEFVSFISINANAFAKSALRIFKPAYGEHKLNVNITDSFVPEEFFPHDGVEFKDWLNQKVENKSLRELFARVLNANNRHIQIDLPESDYDIKIDDYERINDLLEKKAEIDSDSFRS